VTALVAPSPMRSVPYLMMRGVRFGAGIDEAEARMILDSIRTRFPEMGA
jgi:hypothetical protein